MIFKGPVSRQLKLSLCGLLLLVIIVEWAVLNIPSTENAAALAPADTSPTVEQLLQRVSSLHAKDYDALTAAPLFVDGRQPIERSGGVMLGSVKPRNQAASELRLMGLTITKDQSLALIVDSKGSYYRLFLGDEAFGWTLTSVQQDTATLSKHGENLTLSLEKHKIGKASKKRRARTLPLQKSLLKVKK